MEPTLFCLKFYIGFTDTPKDDYKIIVCILYLNFIYHIFRIFIYTFSLLRWGSIWRTPYIHVKLDPRV